MRTAGRRYGRGRATAVTLTAGAVLAALLTGCGGDGTGAAGKTAEESAGKTAAPSGDASAKSAESETLPGVGKRFRSEITEKTRQVVAVHGKGKNSADATVTLFTREDGGGTWTRERSWPAHNGKRGWTTDHHEGDKRTPVGVFTLSDAGGVQADPGARLPYLHSAAFTPPSYWPKKTRHDFDYVIAIDYNRVPGTTPLDPTRPQGQEKGGFIWLHQDHGSGTSGCVSISASGMRHLLRTLDPEQHPVVVMGDRATLRGDGLHG